MITSHELKNTKPKEVLLDWDYVKNNRGIYRCLEHEEDTRFITIHPDEILWFRNGDKYLSVVNHKSDYYEKFKFIQIYNETLNLQFMV